MSKTYKIILVLLVLLLLALTYLEATAKKEVNWNPSYTAQHKIPLGSYVLYENLKVQGIKLQPVENVPYEFLKDTSLTGTYFFLNESLPIEGVELKQLFKWIEKGNTAFLIAEYFSQALLDTLNIKMTTLVPPPNLSSKPLLNFKDPRLKNEQDFLYDRQTYQHVFKSRDSLPLKELGYTRLENTSDKKEVNTANFISDSIGNGAIYLHAMPKAFSNYYLLEQNNAAYAEKALAYLNPEKTVFWDAYYKVGKTFQTSPLYVILNNNSLKWAYYFVLIGSILFVIFEGKRKQRSIPVIDPLRNQSLDFTRTVAGMYLDQKDYKSIASKKIALFLESIRTRYRISTEAPDKAFFKKLAALSENPEAEIKELWQLFAGIENQSQITQTQLHQLDKAIKKFKKI